MNIKFNITRLDECIKRNTKTIKGTINEVRKEEEEDTMRQKMDKVENNRAQLHRSCIFLRLKRIACLQSR